MRWWCVWRTEHRPDKHGVLQPTKVLYNPRTSKRGKSNTPETFGTRAEATAALAAGTYDGLGVLVHESLDVTAGDLDKIIPTERAFDASAIPAEIRTIIDAATTYTEWSPSGTGVHLFFAGTAPHYKTNNGEGALCHAEAYHRLRFMTVTGKQLEGTPDTFNDNAQDLVDWYEALGFEQRGRKAQERQTTAWHADDEDLLRYAVRAANGPKLERLLNGDVSGYRESQTDQGFSSEADAALIGILAFWTQDREQLARIWRGSKLGQRAKLDRDDYIDRTIAFVLDQGGTVYDPNYGAPAPLRQEGDRARQDTDSGRHDTSREDLKAEIQRLTAELDAARETIKTREQVIERERAMRKDAETQLTKLQAQRSRAHAVLRNPDLSVGERLTGFALAMDLGARVANGEMPGDHGYNIPSIRLAEQTGQSEQTVARHLREFDKRGVIRKRVVREACDTVDDDGVIAAGARDRNYIDLEGGTVIDLTERLATYQRPEDAPKHGGTRIPRCDEHPDAGTVKTWEIRCADPSCKKLLDAGETYRAPDEVDTDANTSDTNLIPEPTPIPTRHCWECHGPLEEGQVTLCQSCSAKSRRNAEQIERARRTGARQCPECGEPAVQGQTYCAHHGGATAEAAS